MKAALEGGEWSAARPDRTLPPEDAVPILQEAGWTPGPFWMNGKSRPHRDSIPDSPARSSVAIPTELPGPTQQLYSHFIMSWYQGIGTADTAIGFSVELCVLVQFHGTSSPLCLLKPKVIIL